MRGERWWCGFKEKDTSLGINSGAVGFWSSTFGPLCSFGGGCSWECGCDCGGGGGGGGDCDCDCTGCGGGGVTGKLGFGLFLKDIRSSRLSRNLPSSSTKGLSLSSHFLYAIISSSRAASSVSATSAKFFNAVSVRRWLNGFCYGRVYNETHCTP